MKTLDDLRVGDVTTAQATIDATTLAAFCALTAEAHPVHIRDGLVPGTLLQAVASGALMAAGGHWHVVGLREAHWRFLAPVRAGDVLHVRGEVTLIDALTSDVGLVTATRRVSVADRTCALGTVQIVVGRRAS